MKAVIIARRQSNNESGARLESAQAADEFIKPDRTTLDGDRVSGDLGKCEYPAFGGGYEVGRVAVDRSRLGFELATKKSIQRTVVRGGILRFGSIDSVAMNEARYLVPAAGQTIQNSGKTTKPAPLDESVQKHRSPPGFIEKTEFATAVNALASQLPGLPVDIGDLIGRRRHLLFLRSSGISDRSTDRIVEYTIATVDRSSSELHDFAGLPHDRALNSLAPPAADVIVQLGPDGLFYRHGRTRLFACYRNGQLVGRVVASIDHNFPDPDVGHFGYFESCPDAACADKLLHACEDWLRDQGKKRIEGPVNLNMLAGYRIQTSGFDTQAFPSEPRNPEYYSALLESAGYRVAATWSSWDISRLALFGLRIIDRLKGRSRKISRARGYRVEVLCTDCLEEETQKIHRLVHRIFADNYGFSAIDLEEHLQMQGGAMDGSADIRGAFLYHSSDPDPVGFSYGFFRGRTAIFHTFGVTSAHRGSGGADLLFHYGLQVVRNEKISVAIGALAKAGKSKYERIGSPGRTYAAYAKDL